MFGALQPVECRQVDDRASGLPAAVAGMPAASSAATSAGAKLPEIVAGAVSPPRMPDTKGVRLW